MPIVIPSSSPAVGGPTTTAQYLINRACDLFGYKDPGETLSAADSSNFLAVLNDMIDGWNTQSMFIVTVSDIMQMVSGNPITVGPGGLFNVPRPTSMTSGAYTRLNGIDYGLEWKEQTEYNAIPFKAQGGVIPQIGYYDPELPLGKIYLWPYPAALIELHLQLGTTLLAFADLVTSYMLAPGYAKAIAYSLAEELAPGKRELSPSVVRIAASARRAIRRTNVQLQPQDAGGSAGSALGNFLAGV